MSLFPREWRKRNSASGERGEGKEARFSREQTLVMFHFSPASGGMEFTHAARRRFASCFATAWLLLTLHTSGQHIFEPLSRAHTYKTNLNPHTHKHARTHKHTATRKHTNTPSYKHTHTRIDTCKHQHIHANTNTHTHTHSEHTNIHKHSNTLKQTSAHKHRHSKNAHTNTHTHAHKRCTLTHSQIQIHTIAQTD